MDISSVKKEVEQFNEPSHLSLSDQNEGGTTIQEYVSLLEPTNFSSKQIAKSPSEEYAQLTDPTYWLSYEYQQILAEVKKLNDKVI